VRVWSDDTWTVWRYVPAEAIAQPPAEVVDTGRTTVTVRSNRPTEVALKVRWSRWLSVDGPACVERAGGGTRLRFSGPGTAVVGSRLTLRPRGHC